MGKEGDDDEGGGVVVCSVMSLLLLLDCRVSTFLGRFALGALVSVFLVKKELNVNWRLLMWNNIKGNGLMLWWVCAQTLIHPHPTYQNAA